MADVALTVGGREYTGWKSARVTRGIESIAGTFELEVFDGVGWPVRGGDECSVLVAGEVVLTGYVDRRSAAISGTDSRLTVSGRDRAGDLVDCSADLPSGEIWNVDPLAFARKVAAPFGVPVALQRGVRAEQSTGKVSIDPGESAFDAIDRVCRLAGLLPVSDGRGGLVLTRAGTATATSAIVEGENLLSASVDSDVTGRFARYVVLGQASGGDDFDVEASVTVRAEARDAGVKRSARRLVVRGEGNLTRAQAKRRAEWEATSRAARGDAYTVTVQGWTQADGSVWPINARVRVACPRLGVDEDLLIFRATYSIDPSMGTVTELQLMRPDAFLPQPVVPDRGGGDAFGLLDAEPPGPWRSPSDLQQPKPIVWVPPSWERTR